MHYQDPLPTPASADRLLKEAVAILDIYLKDLIADTDENIESPQLEQRLKTVAKAYEHVHATIKILKPTHPEFPTKHPNTYYYTMQDGSNQLVLMRPGLPVVIPMISHSSWTPDINIAYSVLRHQADDDYAMLWSTRFAHQVTSKLTPPAAILDYNEVQDWIATHDWRSPTQPNQPKQPANTGD